MMFLQKHLSEQNSLVMILEDVGLVSHILRCIGYGHSSASVLSFLDWFWLALGLQYSRDIAFFAMALEITTNLSPQGGFYLGVGPAS